jgi:hypothetical protein
VTTIWPLAVSATQAVGSQQIGDHWWVNSH